MKRIIFSACLLVTLVCAMPTSGQAQKQSAKSSKNRLPVINSITASPDTVVSPCPMQLVSASGGCPMSDVRTITLSVAATDPDNDILLYSYTVTAGQIMGSGRNVVWDFTGVALGSYDVKVEVNDGRGSTTKSTSVKVLECPECDMPCPEINLSRPDEVEEGQKLIFSVNISGGFQTQPTYSWSVSSGKITSGQGTHTIYVETTGLGKQQVTATMKVGGLPPACEMMKSSTAQVRGRRR